MPSRFPRGLPGGRTLSAAEHLSVAAFVQQLVLSLDLPRLAAAAVLVALVLLVVILGLLKWWDHCAKDE